MVETALEMFKNRLHAELADLHSKVQTTFEKAKKYGQKNPEIAFGEFIGLRLGCFQKGDGLQP